MSTPLDLSLFGIAKYINGTKQFKIFKRFTYVEHINSGHIEQLVHINYNILHYKQKWNVLANAIVNGSLKYASSLEMADA